MIKALDIKSNEVNYITIQGIVVCFLGMESMWH